MVVDLVTAGLYALAWLMFGWSASLRSWMNQINPQPWLQVLLYIMAFGGIYFLISLPLSYYMGFVLPHQYGQSNQTLRGWINDQLKGIALGAVLGGLIVEVIYAVLHAFPDTWWVWASILMLLFNVVMANLAPVLLFPLFNKFSPLPDEHSELVARLQRLSERAGTRVNGVFRFDMSQRTKSANAALTGTGSTRRIILGDTLLDSFSVDEIETVLAHELGHHVNKDIPLSIAVETVMTVGGLFLASLALKWCAEVFGFQGPGDVAAFPVLLLVMGVYGLLTTPMTNAFSRWRESMADRYALETTQNGLAFASAMTRIANQNLAEIDPEPWVEFLLHSHPSLAKRIEMARSYINR